MAGKKGEAAGSVVGPGLLVKGHLRTTEPLRVLGALEGNVHVAGPVEVAPGGRVHGDVQAQNVLVEGRIDGNVMVEDKVDLRVTGRVRGDIVAPRVAMVEGSFFRGRLMTTNAARKGRA